MKKQKITHASLTSPATNSHLKGLQQYFTPPEWAAVLGAALPQQRRTLLDPYAGDGSLLRGLANDTTRDILGLDLDPTATLGGPKTWEHHPAANARREMQHGDFLDLLPLLDETATRFDLVALNPPFSLAWPLELLPKPLRTGIKGTTLDSTHATLRIAPTLLTSRGEAILIANAATIARIFASHPQDFANVWLYFTLPSFFPGVDPSLRVAVLYISGEPAPACLHLGVPTRTPADLAAELDAARKQHFRSKCIEEPWNAERDSARAFTHCTEEMERRRNPSLATANIVLDAAGALRTWVSAFQERSFNVPKHLANFLRKINRTHPVELTIQPATRAAITEAIQCGVWSIDPPALAAIQDALTAFATGRAPLAPLAHIQRLGWIDDTEEILCTKKFHEFKAGTPYRLSSQTVDWQKEILRPRYHAGKRSKETILTKGTDLKITIHANGTERHFTFNPENLVAHASSVLPSASCGRSSSESSNWHTLADLAAHFQIPEVPDITSLHRNRYAQNLALIDELELATP